MTPETVLVHHPYVIGGISVRLKDYIRVTPTPQRVWLSDIKKAVATHYQLAPDSLHREITRRYAHPRQIAMYLARKMTKLSLAQIGQQFGGRDHSTVIHAIKAVESRLAADPVLQSDVKRLQAKLCTTSGP